MTSVQCLTFGFYPQLMLLSVYFHFKQSWTRSSCGGAEGSDVILKVCQCLQCDLFCTAVSLLRIKLSCCSCLFCRLHEKKNTDKQRHKVVQDMRPCLMAIHCKNFHHSKRINQCLRLSVRLSIMLRAECCATTRIICIYEQEGRPVKWKVPRWGEQFSTCFAVAQAATISILFSLSIKAKTHTHDHVFLLHFVNKIPFL